MKKYVYKSIAMLFAAGAIMSSCSDFLDAENKTAAGVEADEYFGKTPNELLVAVYSNLKSLVTQVDIHDQGTDLFLLQVRSTTIRSHLRMVLCRATTPSATTSYVLQME